MQSLEKRLTALEAARANAPTYDHLTDAELDERIAVLFARHVNTGDELDTRIEELSAELFTMKEHHAKP
jgi:hypothetical protein